MPQEISIEETSLDMLHDLWTTEQIPYAIYVAELERRQTSVLGADPEKEPMTSPIIAVPDGWRLVPEEPTQEWFERTFPPSGYIRNDPAAMRAYEAAINLRMDEFRLLVKSAPVYRHHL